MKTLPVEFIDLQPQKIPMNIHGSHFGSVNYAYTRKQAVADGVQVDVSMTAREAGIRFPVFMTRAVFDSFVAMPEGGACHSQHGNVRNSSGNS